MCTFWTASTVVGAGRCWGLVGDLGKELGEKEGNKVVGAAAGRTWRILRSREILVHEPKLVLWYYTDMRKEI